MEFNQIVEDVAKGRVQWIFEISRNDQMDILPAEILHITCGKKSYDTSMS